MNPRALWLSLVFVSVLATAGQSPQWIWHSRTNSETVFFRKTFRTPPLTWNARLAVSADDRAEVFLNGVSVGVCADWREPMRSEVSVRLNQGENVLAVRAHNSSGAAGVLVQLNLNGQTNVVSDSSWLGTTSEEPNWSGLAFNAAQWVPAVSLAPHGAPPWGDVLFRAYATPAENLKVADGFRVQLIRSAEPDEGSWICMTFDHRGRLLVSPQGDERPLLRMTLADGKIAAVEKLDAPIHYAMGLLYAFDSLYVNGHGPRGAGLYRLRDENRNDRFEASEVRLLKKFSGESEHGYHGLALGQDQKIYIINGNGTKLPEGISTASPYRHYAEDSLTGGHGLDGDQDGTKAPNCYVLQTDSEGQEWKLWAGGMRNAYDLDFNEDGELFTFDSDMEWDWGTSWYRPMRVLHLVSGGEYGWRDGTRMWADSYPDTLPPVTNIGIGSPTGVKFGTHSNFPEPYRRALYAMDWSYGRILAIHLSPTNSTYSARVENFVQGTPLNLTSLAFAPGGDMYFVTGGRGTQSGLYRVAAVSRARAPSKTPEDRWYRDVRKVRHELEALHGRGNPDSLELILNRLYTSNDRFIWHAARVALESIPVETWRRHALLGKSGIDGPGALLLALVRVGGAENALPAISHALDLRFIDPILTRVIEIALSRYGAPSPDVAAALIKKLGEAYPSHDPAMNHVLCRILLRLEDKSAVTKTVHLLESAPTQEEQMFYIEQLRGVRKGWSLDDRRGFFSWFVDARDAKAHAPELIRYFREAGRGYVDGAWFNRYLRDFRKEAAGSLSAEERAALEPLLLRPLVPAQSVAMGQIRKFVRAWKVEDILPDLERGEKPDLARGRRALADAQCLSCHRFGNDGGMVGPELTGIGSKYSVRDIIESILDPSKVVSDQYQNHTALMKDGDSVSGRLVSESEEAVVIETDRVGGATEKIARKDLALLRPSTVSPMPEGLVNVLTREEILDLIAYLRSAVSSN